MNASKVPASIMSEEEIKGAAKNLDQASHLVKRDDLLALEYALLKKFCPRGIFVVPHYEEIAANDKVTKEVFWDDVVFVNAEPYKDGKFSFFISFPEDYPKSWPRVQFHSCNFHPLISKDDGSLDLRVFSTKRIIAK